MPGIVDRIQRFLHSPQGRRMTERARAYAQDPKNRDKARDALRKVRGDKGQGGARH